MFKHMLQAMELKILYRIAVFYKRTLKIKDWKRWTSETVWLMGGVIWYLIPSMLIWKLFI